MKGIPKINVGSRDPVLYVSSGQAALCSVSGKYKYLSHAGARMAKKRVKKLHNRKVYTYQCQHCSLWHLTSKPRDRW